MKCPIDGSELEKRVYENAVEVDACHVCNGVWLDKNELEKIQDIKLNDYKEELARMPDLIGKSILMSKSKDKPLVACPKCDREMERREYGYSSQIYIDSCINGHGVWLDKNELQALEVFYEKSRFEARDMKKGFLAGLFELLKILWSNSFFFKRSAMQPNTPINVPGRFAFSLLNTFNRLRTVNSAFSRIEKVPKEEILTD